MAFTYIDQVQNFSSSFDSRFLIPFPYPKLFPALHFLSFDTLTIHDAPSPSTPLFSLTLTPIAVLPLLHLFVLIPGF
jgi:hypothetical protein